MASNDKVNLETTKELSPMDTAHNTTENVGRAVTDAVHERFSQNLVYCDNCKEKFVGNSASISKHFNKSHPAEEKCIYCPGKVFHYYKVQNGNDKAEKFYFHNCRDWSTT